MRDIYHKCEPEKLESTIYHFTNTLVSNDLKCVFINHLGGVSELDSYFFGSPVRASAEPIFLLIFFSFADRIIKIE